MIARFSVVPCWCGVRPPRRKNIRPVQLSSLLDCTYSLLRTSLSLRDKQSKLPFQNKQGHGNIAFRTTSEAFYNYLILAIPLRRHFFCLESGTWILICSVIKGVLVYGDRHLDPESSVRRAATQGGYCLSSKQIPVYWPQNGPSRDSDSYR